MSFVLSSVPFSSRKRQAEQIKKDAQLNLNCRSRTDTKKWCEVCQQPTFNWMSCILSGNPIPSSLGPRSWPLPPTPHPRPLTCQGGSLLGLHPRVLRG